MAELVVDLTYGNALFQAAKEVGKVSLILEEANGVLEVLGKEPDLLAFLNTPAIAAKEKKDVMSKIFRGRICGELLNLMCILIDKGRTRHFSRIIGTFKSLIDKEEGFSYGKILSVKPLSKERLSRFEEETGKLLKMNVKLENSTASDLIGGVMVYIDGKIIDASIKGRLKDLKGSMKQ
ncbi:MAG: ATP synthase F1 subunit delta [Clostridiales bacterium]|nr:ATP synthase F1 subunit delta [Clostridiales bacterium]